MSLEAFKVSAMGFPPFSFPLSTALFGGQQSTRVDEAREAIRERLMQLSGSLNRTEIQAVDQQACDRESDPKEYRTENPKTKYVCHDKYPSMIVAMSQERTDGVT